MLMALSASSLQSAFYQLIAAPGAVMLHLTAEFDRDTWETLRKGIDYTEAAQVLPEPGSTTPSFAWLVLLELLRYGGIVLLVVGLVLLVLKLTGLVDFKKKVRHKAPKEADSNAAWVEPNLRALLEGLAAAKTAGDYREAIRIQYQIALYHLSKRGELALRPEKTNWDYVDELRERADQMEFADLTFIFEYIWFGKGLATADKYGIYEPQFLSFIGRKSDGK